MTKLLLSVAFVALGMGTIYAQDLNFGVKAGVNFANVGGDDTGQFNGRTAFHVGAVMELTLSEKFAVQPELVYSSQGFKIDFINLFGSPEFANDGEFKLSYLNIPVLSKYYVAKGFSIEAGPQIGFLIAAKGEFVFTETVDGVTISETVSEDLKDDIKSIDLALGFGLGYKLDNGLNIAARYNVGLSNINDGNDESNFSQRNNVLQLSVGYIF